MPDIATLGFAVDSRPVAEASKDLDRLTAASKKAEAAAGGFGAKTDQAARRAAAANDNVARSADKATASFGKWHAAAVRLASVLGTIAGALVTTAFIRYADAWSDMQSRVGAAIRDMDAAPALMQRIVDIANASYSPLDQTVEVYSRNVAVLRDLGRGATEAADFTEALNHALVLTATRGERAASVQNALSKAMAVGKLQAEGLETILANGGEVAQVLADELGTTVSGLRAMTSAGKITGDVIARALIKRLDDLRDRAAEMPATIGDAFVRIQTNLTAFIGQMDKAAGASEMVATALLSLADNIARIITYAATAVTMFGTYYVAAFVAARLATVTLTGALTLLRAALIRTGIGALVVGAGELVYQFGRLVEATGSFTGALQEMGRRSELLLDAVVWAFRAAGEAIQAVWAGAMADLLRMTEDAFGGILRTLGVSTESMAASIGRLEKRASALGELSKTSAGIAAEQFKGAFAGITMPGSDMPNTPGVRSPTIGEIDKDAKKAADAYKKIVDGAKEFIASQELERNALFMTEEAANALRYEQEMLNKAANDNIKLTAAQRAELSGLATQMAASEAETTRLRKALEFGKDLVRGFVNDLRSGLEQGKTFWESFGDAALNVLDKITDKLLNDVIDALFQVNKAGSGMGGGGGLLGSLFGGLFGPAKSAFTFAPGMGLWAKGGAFPNGISGHSNTIVNTPTAFMFAKGAGIMGEAGPEAIMPLRRDSSGRLGVTAANDRAANQNYANQNVRVEVEVFVNDDGTLGAIARQAGGEAAQVTVKQGLAAYDKGRQKRYQAGGQFG